MKKAVILTLTIINLLGLNCFAQDHHAKHNMILFGKQGGYYASHIVYKSPHNFQVILKLNFDAITEIEIANEMNSYSNEQFIFLLDHMDIRDIQKWTQISGQIFRRDADGGKIVIIDSIRINPDQYSVIYFDELPLSLSSTKKAEAFFEQVVDKIYPLQCAKDDERPRCCRRISNCPVL